MVDVSRQAGGIRVETELIEAGPVEYEIIRNLVPYYVYEMSGPMGWNCSRSGTFGGCDDLAEYWQKGHARTSTGDRWKDPGWTGLPFLVRVDGSTAGFALVRRRSAEPALHEIGEFFVLRRFQKRGVGRATAFALFDRFRGAWEVRQMAGNDPATAFWRRVISAYTNGDFEDGMEDREDGPGPIQRFRNG